MNRSMGKTERYSLPTPPNALFTGREEEVAQLMAWWKEGQPGAIIGGMAGVGKTQLAVQFAWMALGDEAGEETCFVTLDPNFRRPLPDLSTGPALPRSCRLLIIDHVTEESLAREIRSRWSAGGSPFVLITTPWHPVTEAWPSLPTVTLDVFSPTEAATYLTAHVGEELLGAVDVVALARRLGYHPAALALTAVYLRKMGRKETVASVAGRLLEGPLEGIFQQRALCRDEEPGFSPTAQPPNLGHILDRSLNLLSRGGVEEVAVGLSPMEMTQRTRREVFDAYLDTKMFPGAPLHPLVIARARVRAHMVEEQDRRT